MYKDHSFIQYKFYLPLLSDIIFPLSIINKSNPLHLPLLPPINFIFLSNERSIFITHPAVQLIPPLPPSISLQQFNSHRSLIASRNRLTDTPPSWIKADLKKIRIFSPSLPPCQPIRRKNIKKQMGARLYPGYSYFVCVITSAFLSREYRGNSCHHLGWANKGQRDNYTMANCPTSRLAARHNEIISRSPLILSLSPLSFVPFFSGARLGVLNGGGERE